LYEPEWRVLAKPLQGKTRMFRRWRMRRLLARGLVVWFSVINALAAASAAGSVTLKLATDSVPEIVFDTAHDPCAAWDIPDVNARAFRDDAGQIVMFALYDSNRALRGKDLAHLSLDCHSALATHDDPDPAHYDDRTFLTATWTANGHDIVALIHHEYHADLHGRCIADTDLACWYNTILAYHSTDSGATFVRSQPLIVAAPPFRQEVGQGRHRGFFNPSNIFSDGTFAYFFAGTTGWEGQRAGACLFRSATPQNSASWRGFDGRAFSVRYDDPYAAHFTEPTACAPVSPFVFPVGAVVRDEADGIWIAVFQAARNAGVFPRDGFYYAEAKDLTHWSEPRLLLAGATLYSDLCTAGASVIAYPSVLDPTAKSRNFDDVGSQPFLYYSAIDIEKCTTGQRRLMRQRLSIVPESERAQ
jgi:hypothetical protein